MKSIMMKHNYFKVATIALLMVFGYVAQAQKMKVNSAQFLLQEGKVIEAKNEIETALQDAETQSNSKAWSLKGDIYRNIYESQIYYAQNPNALEIADEAYRKANETDNSKKKGNYTEPLQAIGNYMFNEGLKLFEGQNWEAAYQKFNGAKANNEYLIKNNLSTTIDTGYIYATSLAAYNAKKDAEAQALFEKLVAMNYNNELVYESLANIYANNNDAKFGNFLASAMKKYPTNKNLQSLDLKYAVENGKADEAIAKLKKSIEADPTNANLKVVLANFYEEAGKKQDAIKYYKEASDIDPTYTDAIFNIGVIYFNEAIAINKVINSEEKTQTDSLILSFLNNNDLVNLEDIANAPNIGNLGGLINSLSTYKNDTKALAEKLNKLNENTKYDLMTAKRNALYAKALPYLEQAYAKDKNFAGAKTALKEIYARMNMLDKVQSLD
ncbi:MAG: tetratricopeptide repeat protein [Chitinophagales bacterium]